MVALTLHELCSDLMQTAGEIRIAMRAHAGAPRLLERFWRLQDQLHRLVACVADNPSEGEALSEICPDLATRIIDVLTSAAFFKVDKLPALGEACWNINNYLLELEHAKQERRSRSATASA